MSTSSDHHPIEPTAPAVSPPAPADAYDETATPIWEILAEFGRTVPDEAWASVPTDLSKRLDYYLCGIEPDDTALIAADELSGLLETAHLLRSPANADRLLRTLARIRQEVGTPAL